ncbi:TPA: hydrogenase nickel incorporation protein HypB [Providencia rettgeri]|uniref:hydrogenase nickel incorporation protein HypB n=1 Tax=Providencia TaxID=586 RepID=UPI001B8F9EDA|nr:MULTISPECIES: hydrogenase nickel incorporation protein HypB [Providencia]EMB5785866.1 hydrogenase nickel incorporation protein HypB [Providencia rettgeri]MDK7744276.1 hydrogenase nickel incorporation protein HypB [Providencia rettgeri]MDK7756999.1 hydrogenase nickel incorporation protein HypB [Providencia rettgeri]HBC7429479.1 hydrogenase nickel incorporation protein HypB [Providencia rettgeri]
MCSTCGCASGERKIEGDDHHHGHDHHHDHDHHHGHDHHHDHDHHDHQHDHESHGQTVIIHHHYYHQGDVHNHYHQYEPAPAENKSKKHKHKHKHKHIYQTAEASFKPAGEHHDLDYGHGEAGTHAPGISQKRMLQIEMDVLDKNNHLAEHNREDFNQKNILALNLVSSPGSGKTTLLTETLLRLRDKINCAVIEGDQQTTNDAQRIRETGVSAIQVNTGKGCHLDAQMVHDATARLDLADNSLLFIENVGNLVCPASFDLGERHKVAVLSVTEGEDKPLKYPHMFAAADIMLLNKIDLLPYLNFDVDACIANAKQVNPNIQVIQVSAIRGEGMDAWLAWLETQLCA